MGKSKRDIQTKLKQKGVEEVLIQKALEAYSQADEGKNLKNFIKKQALLLSEYPPAIKRKKLTEKAVRRGFAYEDISREIEAVLENENSDDYEEYYIKKIKKRISASKDSDEAKLRAKLYSEFLPLGAEKELINTLIENAKGNGEE